MPRSTACEQANEVIWATFSDLPPIARRALGNALRRTNGHPHISFLQTLGIALESGPPLHLAHAIAVAVDSGEATELIGTLGDDEPWRWVREALEYVIENGVTPADRVAFLDLKRRFLDPGDPGYDEVWAV